MSADRVGPDLPFTHWLLYFKSTQVKLCRRKFAKFGEGAQFRPGAYAVGCSKIEIGKRVIIRPGTKLFAESETLNPAIVIEDNVMIGCGVHFYIHNHRFDRADIPLIEQGHYPAKQIILEEGCWIGANTILLPGVTIGRNDVVGAGSVVTKSIPAHTLVVGNPARIVQELNYI